MKVCLLASGSKGNALYLEHRSTAILIDQGLSLAELTRRMDARGLDPHRITAIFISHEHTDHIAGVGVTARKLGIPVYATAGSISGMKRVLSGDETLITIEGGTALTLGPFEVLPYTVSHDAAEPVQFCITGGRKQVTVATDIGFVSTLVAQRLTGSDLVVIESNYDDMMLRQGSYPWPLKQRISGKSGHLSNTNASEAIFNCFSSSRERPHIILAHLSEENNTPDLAETTIRALFDRFDRPLGPLHIACQHEPTPVIEL